MYLPSVFESINILKNQLKLSITYDSYFYTEIGHKKILKLNQAKISILRGYVSLKMIATNVFYF